MASGADTRRRHALAAFARRAPGHCELLASALADEPRDPELLLADAAAAAEQGFPQPFARLESAVAADPGWAAGYYRLAQLRIEFAVPDPLAPIEEVLAQRPDDPRLWHHYLVLLSALDRHAEAADRTAELRRRIGEVPGLRLLEARFAGLAGEPERGRQLLEGLPADLPDLLYQRVRNALQRGAAGEAAHLLGDEPPPGDIRLWALAELAWRALGDPRHERLLSEGALLATFDIALADEAFAALCEVLRQMHRTRVAPPSQSLRGGTQTRGQLHLREEPVLAPLFAGFRAAISAYARGLPPLPGGHPLAPAWERVPEITASWSVRLTAGGFHVPHLHSEGLLSSACHLVVPGDGAKDEGVLEIGRPPRDIPLGLEPLARFAPRPLGLVLFPSFLYHSTSPFGTGERLTAVFDAA